MSYQYSYCPACGMRRVAYQLRCSVCGGLVRRTPVGVHTTPGAHRVLLNWRAGHPSAARAAEPRAAAA
jgi:hypothetical protein